MYSGSGQPHSQALPSSSSKSVFPLENSGNYCGFPHADNPEGLVHGIDGIAKKFPAREAGSQDEKRAMDALACSLRALQLPVDGQVFSATANLYQVILAHIALGIAGNVLLSAGVSAIGALACHSAAAALYCLESNKLFPLLRWLLPHRQSLNQWGVLSPRSGQIQSRVVLLGHVDAAPTGVLFSESIVRLSAKSLLPEFLACIVRRPLLLLVLSFVAMAGIDILFLTTGYLMSINLGIATLLQMFAVSLLWEPAFVRKIVPGANDNLSGCAATLTLAHRFTQHPPEHTEFWFVLNGAEESGNCGARYLLKTVGKHWDRENTLVVAIDSIGKGQLKYHVEGEFYGLPIDPRVLKALKNVSARSPQWRDLEAFHAPAGATDAAPFLRSGFQSVAITRIDSELGVPAHYHLPSDNAANLNAVDLASTIDFVEALCLEWLRARQPCTETIAHAEAALNGPS